jgi:hypothetical protein
VDDLCCATSATLVTAFSHTITAHVIVLTSPIDGSELKNFSDNLTLKEALRCNSLKMLAGQSGP